MEITIIVTLYNDSNIVRRMVDLNIKNLKKYNDLEVVFVDDCSSDNTVETLKTCLHGIEIKYRIFTNNVNLGVAASRNYGIDVSKGKYIVFLDSDDLWHVDKIGLQRDLIIKTGADVIAAESFYTSYKQVNANSLRMPVNCNYKKVLFLPSLFRTPFVTPSVFMLKSVLNEERFPDSMRYAEDYNLWLRLIYKYKVIKLDCALVHVITDEESSDNVGLSDSFYKMHKGIKVTLWSYSDSIFPLYIRVTSLLAVFFEYIKFPIRVIRRR
jgi:teichuronic acid biosynthesis glycosyltransferase TuaG